LLNLLSGKGEAEMNTGGVEVCTQLPEREGLDDLLSQYYQLIVARMTDMGFDIDPAAPKSALAEFWENATDYLPPIGCMAIARDDTGAMIGVGMMRCLDAETGELKRLFVSEAGRGLGLGRRLLEARIEAAKGMGLKRLVADTLTPNVEMRSLYPKLGFVELTEPIETTTYIDQPMLRPHLHYFVREL
jgi:GNAT superfamily N-acetyltransferase